MPAVTVRCRLTSYVKYSEKLCAVFLSSGFMLPASIVATRRCYRGPSFSFCGSLYVLALPVFVFSPAVVGQPGGGWMVKLLKLEMQGDHDKGPRYALSFLWHRLYGENEAGKDRSQRDRRGQDKS